jgi:hypothetical protein
MDELSERLRAFADRATAAAQPVRYEDVVGYRSVRPAGNGGWMAAALVAVFLVVVGSGAVYWSKESRQTSPDEEALSSGDNGEGVSSNVSEVAGLELVQAHAGAVVAASGDRAVVVDGLFPGESGSHLRIVVAPGGEGEGTAWEYPEFGPLGSVSAARFGDEVVVGGQRCPEPFDGSDPEGPRNNEAFCGSVLWDVISVDPATGNVRKLVDGLSLGADDGLVVVAATSSEVLVSTGEQVTVLGRDGSSVEGEALDLGGEQVLEPGSVCSVGEQFVALRPLGHDDAGVNGPVRGLNEFFEAYRWASGSWEPATLPSTDVSARAAFPLGCGVEGHLISTVSSAVVEGELVESEQRAATLGTGGEGLEWSEVPLDELPDSAAPPMVQEVGGRVAVGILDYVPPQAADPRPAQMFIWMADHWIEPGITGNDAYNAWPPAMDAAITDSEVLTYLKLQGSQFESAIVEVTQ